jgi:hypothetical protein
MTFSDLGTVASIISLTVSIFVLADVRKIRNAFTLKIRGPIIIKELGKCSSNISGYLDQFEDFLPQIEGEFARAKAKLKYLQKKLPASPRTSVKKLRKSIEKCQVSIENKDGVRRVYVEMNQVLEEVKDHQKDLKLGV